MPDAPKGLLTRAVTFETRDTSSDGFTLEGYAAVFDSPTRIDSWEGTFDEIVLRGAFAKTLKERTPVMQFDHGHDIATGSVPIAAIDRISEDDHGLFVRARLFDNPRVEPIRHAIAGGAIDGMSFRFRVIREEWSEEPDVPVRSIKELQLFELGPVVFPAYEATSVGVRSLLADLDDRQRAQLVAELTEPDDDAWFSKFTIIDKASDAAPLRGTSQADPDAATPGTSGSNNGRDPRAVAALAAVKRASRPRKEEP